MARTIRLEFVSRGPVIAGPDDGALLELVPPGEGVPRRRLESLLGEAYLTDCAAWSWTTCGDGLWPAMRLFIAAAKRQVEQAVDDGILCVSEMLVTPPERDTWQDVLLNLIRRLLSSADGPPITPAEELIPHRMGH